MHQFISTVIFLCVTSFCFAQQLVTGQVIEGVDKEPLVGAAVYLQGTNIGTITNDEGSFSLNVPSDSLSLLVSYTGYETRRISLLRTQKDLVITLKLGVILDGPTIVNQPYHPSSQYYKESPALVTLSNEQLQFDERTNIAPTLNRVPGVYMHSGSLNTNRLTVRGVGSRNLFGTAKIRAFLGDIPLTNGSGETTIEDIDLSLVDNVQIVKGPTSSVYGAGLGGVIYMNPDQEFEGNEVTVSNTLGSYNLQRNIMQYKYGKDDFNIGIGLNRTHSGGYRDNNEYDRLGFTVLGNYEKEDKALTFLFNHIDLKSFIPSSLNEEDYLNNPQKAAFTWAQVKGFEDYNRTLIGLSYKTDIGNNWDNTSSVFHTQFRSYESRPFNILRQNSTALGGRTKFRANLFEYHQLEFGAEFYHENYDWQTNVTNNGQLGNLLSDNAEQRQYWNSFLQTRWYIGNEIIGTLGVNYNLTDYELTDRFTNDSLDLSGDYSFDPVLSPFLTLHYEPSWIYNSTLFAIVSHGFAPPTLEETLTPDGLINPEIQPEQGWNFEIGTRGMFRNIIYNLSLYSMHIQDLLVARRTAADQFIGINAGKTVHNGLELSLQSDYRIGYTFKVYPFLNYSYSDYTFKDFIDGDKDFSGNELTGTAPHIGSAGLRFTATEQNAFYGNINYQYVAAMPLRDDNSVYSNAYNLLNAKLGYRFYLGLKWKIDLMAGINNIWNEKYASMLLINAEGFGGSAPRYYYPGLPRHFYGGVTLKYEME